jgi:uncharacterized protein
MSGGDLNGAVDHADENNRNGLLRKMLDSPAFVRVFPFAVFAAATLAQSRFGEAPLYWIYALKTVIGACLLWLLRSRIKEMRLNISWEAVAVGVAVFGLWIGLDGCYPTFQKSESFNPVRAFGQGSILSLLFIAVRIAGSSLVVPFLEEVFYRSFLYRFVIQSRFWKLPLGQFDLRSFIVTAVVFGVGHFEWLPGILCAFAYQGLVCRKRRLGDAICAHAVTNLLLGIWVVFRGAYHFW